MTKAYHLELEEQNGEQEYSYDFLIYAKDEEEARVIAQNYAQTFYGEDDDAGKEIEDNVYEFLCGCIIVEIKGFYETTKELFIEHILTRYSINLPQSEN